MSHDDLRDLVERAVPEVPAELLTPPTTRIIHAAARRRRRTAWTATGAAGAVLAVLAAAAVLRPAPAPPIEVPPPSPSGGPLEVVAQVGWQVARVARDGRSVRLYVDQPPDLCAEFGPLTAVVDESDEHVTLTATGGNLVEVSCEPGSGPATAEVRATLDRPLGDRALEDGSAPGRDRLVVREADLPSFTGWTAIPATYRSLPGTSFPFGYTRAGGPDLRFEAFLTPPARSAPAGTVKLGSRTGTVYPTGDWFEVLWEAHGVTYSFAAQPAEGQRLEKAQFEQLIRDMTWP
ncbi:hypothetical protein ACFFX1_53740 [Dactylosporangium sucinum]|uniref:DUF4367 domain-containing protein n=1 Tax=Dactylosporangium sucinum TaxID=1424081 RepID=A0A917U635_9ACTN|nr:hypothetical protein [Dactylosporangium sucinum]GGM61625.1 hypothetical protein GCM10007977_073860 [Dactylosporangium sucinum]